ncbi:MAG: hypothetical protein EON47_12295 [Acetobacteraceae bacterium]|nr:MAG: hypothetical protein EON47_12295 [Acetobacteraceae bacterium]
MSGGFGLERARRLLALPGAWLEAVPGRGYGLRTGPDRRARIMLTLDEAGFRALTAEPGLRTRPTGGWTARAGTAPAPPSPAPGRPGVKEGTRVIMLTNGEAVERRANLATSPVAWLAARTDADGRPWLSRAEIAGAEQLTRDAEAALRGPAVTMRWDAVPRVGSGGGRRREPGDAAMAAGLRVERALAACGPARAMVQAICLNATPLQLAEQDLGLRRRTGKTLLRQGLILLARHYRLM